MRQDKPLKNKQPCFPYPSFLCFFFSSDLQRTRPRSAPQEELHRRCSAKPVPPPRLAHRRCHVRHPPLRCWSPPVFSSIHQCLRVWHAHAMMSEWMQINRISRYIYIYSYLHYNTHYKYSRYINSDWWQHIWYNVTWQCREDSKQNEPPFAMKSAEVKNIKSLPSSIPVLIGPRFPYQESRQISRTWIRLEKATIRISWREGYRASK